MLSGMAPLSQNRIRSRVVVQFDPPTCGFTLQSEPLPVIVFYWRPFLSRVSHSEGHTIVETVRGACYLIPRVDGSERGKQRFNCAITRR